MILELADLEKTFSHGDASVTVLKGLNFTANRGETIAILGPSGSGKSTLLTLLAGLDRPTAGRISIQGEDLHRLNEESLTRFRSKNLSIIFQQFHLMANLTALENVTLPLEIAGIQDAETKAKNALTSVGLGHRFTHFPTELSGGECQRVAIARAVAVEAPILLADEPSGNLDQKTGHEVMKMLFELVKSKGSTLILVTHNEQLASWCDRQFNLQDGKLWLQDRQ